MNILETLEQRRNESFALHEAYLNPQMVRVLKTIGFDRRYVRAEGAYLFDDHDERYLDLLGGFGVFALGRNHPQVVKVLSEVLNAHLPHLVQLDASLLAGLLAERLVRIAPDGLERIFFANSGTEAVEAAIKFSRHATRRTKILYCRGSFHGLTLGSLSATGEDYFRDGFGPLLPGFEEVPFGDADALEQCLAGGDVAAFIVEPIQGHGVFLPPDGYLSAAAALCRRHGALLIADEVQTGLGRTGRYWAVEHWGVEPDLLCMAKALSGGFVPVGAVACRRWVFDKVFDRMDRAVVHGSTFAKNNLAMAAGLATLEVLEQERLVERAAELGARLIGELRALEDGSEFLKQVRGKGLMIGLEFGEPDSLKLKTAWRMLEKANKGLFCQMVTIPLFSDHRILSQVAGHGIHVVKFLPPLVISDDDLQWIVDAVRQVVADTERVPGAIWNLGRTLATQAMRARMAAS